MARIHVARPHIAFDRSAIFLALLGRGVQTLVFCACLFGDPTTALSDTLPGIGVVLRNFDYSTAEPQLAAKRRLLEASLVLALDAVNITLFVSEQSDVRAAVAGNASALAGAKYLLSARLEAQGGRLQLSGSLSPLPSVQGKTDIDVEPVMTDYQNLFSAVGEFANNISTAINKEHGGGKPKVRVAVGCFSSSDISDVGVLQYLNKLPVILSAHLTDGERFDGVAVTPSFEECERKPLVKDLILRLKTNAVIMGTISKSDKLLIVQPILLGNEPSEKLPLPELRLEANGSLDSRQAAAYITKVVAYLDGVLSKIGSSQFQEFSSLSADALVQMARAQQDNREVADTQYAVALLETAIQKAPSSSEAYFLLGKLKYDAHDDSVAIPLVESSLKLGWNADESRALLKRLYLRNHMFVEARNLCNAQSDSGSKNRCIGDTFLSERKLDEALAAYSASVRDAPEIALGWYQLGLVQEARKDVGDAFKQYSTALAKDSNFYPAKERLALLKFSLGGEAFEQKNYSSARNYYTESLSYVPLPITYFRRALTYIETGDSQDVGRDYYYKMAISDFNAAKDLLGDIESVISVEPWLIPNVAELEVVVGNLADARQILAATTPRLNPDAKLRYGADWRLVKFICNYIDFAAATLLGEDVQASEAVLQSAMSEVDLRKSGWDFGTMRKFLASTYLQDAQGDQLRQRQDRAERVQRIIERIEALRTEQLNRKGG